MSVDKSKRFRSGNYVKWVKSQGSILSGESNPDFHHAKCKGLCGGIKSSDAFGIPLTREEHTEYHALGQQKWEAKHNVKEAELALLMLSRALDEGVLQITW